MRGRGDPERLTRSSLARGLAAALASGMLVAGCGSSHEPPVARVGSTATSTSSATSTAAETTSGTSTATSNPVGSSGPATQATIEADALEFAQCMRSHGVPNFPDPPNHLPNPNASAPGSKSFLGNGPNPNSPTVEAGDRACRRYAVAEPVSAGVEAAVQSLQLRYAKCMRAHGVPGFPDPSSTGGFAVPKSIDDNSPALRAAESACKGLARLPPGVPGSDGG